MSPALKSIAVFSPALLLAVVAPASAAVVAFEFNTPGNVQGWSAPASPPNAAVTNLRQATGIDGTTGVLTSDNIDIDAQLNIAPNTIFLPAGERWSNFQVRFRQLNNNPGTAGVAALPYSQAGTLIFFNGTLENTGPGNILLGTNTRSGAGAYAGDTYVMNLTTEAGGGQWQLLDIGLSGAPVLNSQNFTGVRFDPVGDAAEKNFEIDYIRAVSVPEAGSTILTLLAAGAALGRRRR